MTDTLLFNSQANVWEFHSRPHIRALLRRVFHAKANERGRVVKLTNTEGHILDIQWILSRHPHEIDPNHAALLRRCVAAASARKRQTDAILAGELTLPPAPLALPLRDYQASAVELTVAVGGLLVGDDLGLGKTAIGIGLCAQPDAGQCVIVCPVHLQEQWQKQFRKFAPHISTHIAKKTEAYPVRAQVLIVSYSKLKGWCETWGPRTVVFDEAHELRDRTTARYGYAVTMCEEAERRLALTATPVYNYGGEVFSVLEVVRPGGLGTPDEFYKEWCRWDGRGRWIVEDPPALGAYLRDNSLMLRRTRADVGKQLPPVATFIQEVKYDEKAMERVEGDALQYARLLMDSSSSFEAKGQASRKLDGILRQGTGLAKAPYVAALVADLAASGKKILLSGWHRAVYDVWQHYLTEAGIPIWFYTGSESPTQKTEAAASFIAEDGPGVLIISNRSGAGLDGLQTVCDLAIIGELDWTPQALAQLIGRLQRDGQANPNGVTVIYCVANRGSDPTVSSVLGVKIEQGHGISDPEISLESLPVAEQLTADITNVAENRVRELAKDFLKRYASDS